MKLFILRHGETAYNRDNITQDVNYDIPLTDKAIAELHKEAPNIVDQLTINHVTYMLCSPMYRTRQTMCELLASPLFDNDVSIHFCTNMREVDFGKFSGTPESTIVNGCTMQSMRDDIKQSYSSMQNVQFPDGESIADICKRCMRVLMLLDKLSAKHDNIVLVGHNRFFRHLLVALGHWSPAVMFDSKLPHGKLYEVGEFNNAQLDNCIHMLIQHIRKLTGDIVV